MTGNAYSRAISLGSQGLVDLPWLVSHRYPLSDATKAFETAARREGLKVVIDVTAD